MKTLIAVVIFVTAVCGIVLITAADDLSAKRAAAMKEVIKDLR